MTGCLKRKDDNDLSADKPLSGSESKPSRWPGLKPTKRNVDLLVLIFACIQYCNVTQLKF